MTQEEFETFKSLIEKFESLNEKFENEVIELFQYIKEKHLDVLEFGRYSSYHHYDINNEAIWIEYYDSGYDCYDSRNINIPINDFINRPKEWVDEWANAIRKEKTEKEKQKLEIKEKKEREEFERLKKKYESKNKENGRNN